MGDFYLYVYPFISSLYYTSCNMLNIQIKFHSLESNHSFIFPITLANNRLLKVIFYNVYHYVSRGSVFLKSHSKLILKFEYKHHTKGYFILPFLYRAQQYINLVKLESCRKTGKKDYRRSFSNSMKLLEIET